MAGLKLMAELGLDDFEHQLLRPVIVVTGHRDSGRTLAPLVADGGHWWSPDYRDGGQHQLL